jgi:DNA-directed RNA polymerase specialized sigma24 family protein
MVAERLTTLIWPSVLYVEIQENMSAENFGCQRVLVGSHLLSSSTFELRRSINARAGWLLRKWYTRSLRYPMPKQGGMSQDDFYRLLQWFGPDRDASAKKYLEAHGNLTRYFRFNYCECPEDLADEVMNRVASKLPPLWEGRSHTDVLLGFARFVLLEYLRAREVFVDSPGRGDEILEAGPTHFEAGAADEKERRSRCFDICLAKLPEGDIQLLVNYHRYERGGKSVHRKAMAEARGMTLNALRLRASRLKSAVGDCVKLCCQPGGLVRMQ